MTPGEFRKLRKFQPFVQTAIGKNSGKGSGLGLPIVRQLIALSGGKMVGWHTSGYHIYY